MLKVAFDPVQLVPGSPPWKPIEPQRCGSQPVLWNHMSYAYQTGIPALSRTDLGKGEPCLHCWLRVVAPIIPSSRILVYSRGLTSGPLCLIDTGTTVYINTPSRRVYFSALNVDGSNFQPQRSGPHCSGPTTLDTMKLWASLMLALTALPMMMAQDSSLTQTLAKFPGCAVSGHVEFTKR